MPDEILPAVRDPDEASRPRAPRDGGAEGEGVAVTLGEEQRDAFVIADPRRVACAPVAQVRRQQHEEPVRLDSPPERREAGPLQHHVAAGVGQNLLVDPITPLRAGVARAVGRNALGQAGHVMAGMALLLREEVAAVGHDQPEVPGARMVEAGVVSR
jgi:hypothetical protein